MSTQTKVIHIGLDGTIETLRRLLDSEPLEPIWGEPVELSSECKWLKETPPEASQYKYYVSGNFYKTSCVFHLWTNDENLVNSMIKNSKSDAYNEIKASQKEAKEKRNAELLRIATLKQQENISKAKRLLRNA